LPCGPRPSLPAGPPQCARGLPWPAHRASAAHLTRSSLSPARPQWPSSAPRRVRPNCPARGQPIARRPCSLAPRSTAPAFPAACAPRSQPPRLGPSSMPARRAPCPHAPRRPARSCRVSRRQLRPRHARCADARPLKALPAPLFLFSVEPSVRASRISFFCAV
jgi:hypothetical protein